MQAGGQSKARRQPNHPSTLRLGIHPGKANEIEVFRDLAAPSFHGLRKQLIEKQASENKELRVVLSIY